VQLLYDGYDPLVTAVADKDPKPDHQLWLRAEDEGQRATKLAELPDEHKDRARKVIVENICECDFCVPLEK
jgi:hypothetical protein